MNGYGILLLIGPVILAAIVLLIVAVESVLAAEEAKTIASDGDRQMMQI